MYDECVTTAHSCTYIVLVSPFFFFFLWLFCSTLPRSPSTHCCSTIPKPCLSEPLFDKGCAEIPQAFFLIRLPPIVTMFTPYGGQRARVSAGKPGSHHVISRCAVFSMFYLRTEKSEHWEPAQLLFSLFLPWTLWPWDMDWMDSGVFKSQGEADTVESWHQMTENKELDGSSQKKVVAFCLIV